jgi:hypothetical protein
MQRVKLCRTAQSSASMLTVLVGDDLPELGTDLVAALASLDVDDLAHGCLLAICWGTLSGSRSLLN